MSILLLMTVLLVSCQKEEAYTFKISDAKLSKELFSIYQVTPEEAMEWMYDSTLAVFIDLRSKEVYNEWHLENAINIPTHNLLSPDFKSDFDGWLKDSLTVVLYGNSDIEANAPWMLMYQLGYTNARLLLGGYSYIDRLYLDELEEGESFEPEVAKFDYAAIIEEVKNSKPEIVEVEKEKEVKKVTVKKVVKKESEGGC